MVYEILFCFICSVLICLGFYCNLGICFLSFISFLCWIGQGWRFLEKKKGFVMGKPTEFYELLDFGGVRWLNEFKITKLV